MCAGGPPARYVWRQAFKNFLDSLTVVKPVIKDIGTDFYGNKFFEKPPNKRRGYIRPERWYEPTEDMKFDSKFISPEWDSWLRNRRPDPPTMEECQANVDKANMKKLNADNLAAAEGKNSKSKELAKHENMSSFPTYGEYEVMPGQGSLEFVSEKKKKK